MREKIAVGIAEVDAGRLADGEEFLAELERDERAQDQAPALTNT